MTERKAQARQISRQKARTMWTVLGAIAVLGIGGYFAVSERSPSAGAPQTTPTAQSSPPVAAVKTNTPSHIPYKVGRPGPGEMAPPIKLTTTRGAPFDLESLRGQTVLLYFQEGLMCDACWDQLRDIETNFTRFRAMGITSIVTITTDPPDLLAEKVRSGRYFMPVMSDPSVAVSRAYHANDDGMMGKGTRYDAHTFIIVGPDGKILWRGDYGGAPNYAMYIPVTDLVADMLQGMKQDTQTASP